MEWNKRMRMSCVAGMTLVLCVCTAFGMKYGIRKDVETFSSDTSYFGSEGEEWTQIPLGSDGTGSTVMICQGGRYRIRGTLEEGQVCVDTADGEEVVLCLAGVQIHNSEEAAIYIKNAEQTTILLEAGTENVLQSGIEEDTESEADTGEKEIAKEGVGGAAGDEEAGRAAAVKEDAEKDVAENKDAENEEGDISAKAVVYARDDLKITGEGALKVYGCLRNGIHTTNHLTIDSGTIRVEAVDTGIKGKDSVTVTGGDLSIISGGDGIKSNDTTGEDYGQIHISGGTFQIESGGDGIQAETVLDISGGEFTIISGGGSEAAPVLSDRAEEGFFGRSGGNGGSMPWGGEGEKSAPPDAGGEQFPPLPDGEGGMSPPLSLDEGERMPSLLPGEEWAPSPTSPPDEGGDALSFLPEGEGEMNSSSPLDGGEESRPPQMDGEREWNPSSSNDGGKIRQQPFEGESESDVLPSDTYHPEERGHREGMPGGGQEMSDSGMEERGAWESGLEDTEEDTAPSCKGLKSGTRMEISGGVFTVDACDDAFHSDGTILVSDGMLSIKSGDDGVHADTELTVTGGTVEIETCYEGLEANQILIEDGEIRITSSDDGINANGGMDRGWPGRGMGDREEADREESENAEEMPNLCIIGGTVLVDAGGDGLDSNGNLTISGGTVIVDGPSDNGNGALDSGSESGGRCLVYGGLVLAIGSSGMAESFDSDSKQCFFSCHLSSGFQEGSVITITDTEGQVLYTHTAAKSGSSVVFSCPGLEKGEAVLLEVDGEAQEIEI